MKVGFGFILRVDPDPEFSAERDPDPSLLYWVQLKVVSMPYSLTLAIYVNIDVITKYFKNIKFNVY